ncbi:MAG: hypothetical protein ACXVBE_15130 [Bdellovibrionota bacterium]
MSHLFTISALAALALLPTVPAFAAGCEGLGDGGSYARNIAERKGNGGKQTVGKNQKQGLSSLKDNIKQKLNACASAVPAIRNVSGFDRIESRLEKASDAHTKYTKDSDVLCQKYGLTADKYGKQAKDMANDDRSSNLPTKQSFEKQAKLDKDAATDYSSLAKESRGNGKSVQDSMPGIGQDKDSKGEDKEMKNAIDGYTQAMKSQMAFLKKQASQKLAERNKTAGGDSSDGMGGGQAVRFKTQADVDKFYKGMDQCDAALEQLNGKFNNDYKKLAADLSKAKAESENAAEAFDSTGSKLAQSGAQMDQTAQKMGGDDSSSSAAPKTTTQRVQEGHDQFTNELAAQQKADVDKQIRQGQNFTNSTSTTPYTQQERLDKLYQPDYQTVTTSDGIYRVYTSKGDGSKIRIKQ